MNRNTTIDADSSFNLKFIQILNNGSFISFILDKYINTGIRNYPQQSLTHDLDIYIVSKPQSNILSNDIGGSIETTEGLEINIEPDTILEKNEIYTGKYEIQIFYINPKNTSNNNK